MNPRAVGRARVVGGAAKAETFSGQICETSGAFESSPCLVQEHLLPPPPVGTQFLVTVWLQPPWGHSWEGDTSKRLMGTWEGVPNPTFNGMQVGPLIFPGRGMGMAWEGQGEESGEMDLPLEPR